MSRGQILFVLCSRRAQSPGPGPTSAANISSANGGKRCESIAFIALFRCLSRSLRCSDWGKPWMDSWMPGWLAFAVDGETDSNGSKPALSCSPLASRRSLLFYTKTCLTEASFSLDSQQRCLLAFRRMLTLHSRRFFRLFYGALLLSSADSPQDRLLLVVQTRFSCLATMDEDLDIWMRLSLPLLSTFVIDDAGTPAPNVLHSFTWSRPLNLLHFHSHLLPICLSHVRCETMWVDGMPSEMTKRLHFNWMPLISHN